jgi:hypothetical protein
VSPRNVRPTIPALIPFCTYASARSIGDYYRGCGVRAAHRITRRSLWLIIFFHSCSISTAGTTQARPKIATPHAARPACTTSTRPVLAVVQRYEKLTPFIPGDHIERGIIFPGRYGGEKDSKSFPDPFPRVPTCTMTDHMLARTVVDRHKPK